MFGFRLDHNELNREFTSNLDVRMYRSLLVRAYHAPKAGPGGLIFIQAAGIEDKCILGHMGQSKYAASSGNRTKMILSLSLQIGL